MNRTNSIKVFRNTTHHNRLVCRGSTKFCDVVSDPRRRIVNDDFTRFSGSTNCVWSRFNTGC